MWPSSQELNATHPNPEIRKAVGAIYVIYSELLFDMDIN